MTAVALTIGETMGLVRAAEPGRLEQVNDLRLGIGGAESNVAIGLARLGVPVRWAGRVGDDGVGRRIARELRAEGVDAHAIVDPGAPTGLMLKHAYAGRTIVDYYRAGSAGSRFAPADAEELDLTGVGLVHVTGITLAISESARAAALRLVDRAREAGIPVSFDVNHRSRLWEAETAAPLYRALAERADVLFAGVEEAEIALSGLEDTQDSPRELAHRLLALGAGEAVLKLGADGCFAATREEEVRVEAHPVTVVDTVGAGDAFVAGYLAELLAGGTLAERTGLGAVAGALACASPGDWEGAPTRRDVQDALAGKDPVMR